MGKIILGCDKSSQLILFLLKSSIEMIINTQVHRNDGLASNKIAHFTVLYLMAWPLSESEAGVHLVVINDDF